MVRLILDALDLLIEADTGVPIMTLAERGDDILQEENVRRLCMALMYVNLASALKKDQGMHRANSVWIENFPACHIVVVRFSSKI